ncbi:hypothetical protein SUGI_0072300 [Cryptomeria japonica]|uniref:uncharacterized protein LOC131044961 n=1 Tax=Cryptomeria japonica TaxID=3369 RepID=UPI002408BDE5|nr:uncharacterized protein LOC131044961 [Cryptomeria japonica]GLJ07676.1 hypothetical protein SUGI_0072300 [Cryptomeria japonica]
MALLRRFLKNTKVICLKPSYSLKSLSTLHTHGSISPQSSNRIPPWLLNPPEVNSNPQVGILDLLRKYQAFGLCDPVVGYPSQQYGKEAGLSKHLEQCRASQKLREGSESAVAKCFVSTFLEGSGTEEGMKIWADSVKKKRRKKMNKHKYKKLRKRLRRKSRKK